MTALVFLIMVTVLPISYGSRLVNADGDLARHLRQGREIVETGSVARTDRFSWPTAGRPFVSFEYGSQIALHLAERIGGLSAVVLLASLLLAGTSALLARFMLLRGVDPLLVLFTTFYSALIAQVHWIARPHLVTFLFTITLLGWLDRDEVRPWWHFGLLFLIWANLHAGFLFGIFLIGLWFVGELIDAWLDPVNRTAGLGRARKLFVAGVIATLVTFVNAYGPGLHAHALGNLSDTYMKDHTSEFMSPDFHLLGTKFFLVAVLAILGAALAFPRRMSMPRVLVITATVGLSLIAGRNIALFAITGFALGVVHFSYLWDRVVHRVRALRQFGTTARAGSTMPWVVGSFGLVLVMGVAGSRIGIPSGFEEPGFPVSLVRDARAADLQGRLFNDFRYGGYLQYAWPEQKIFIDGTTDVYGGQHQRSYINVLDMVPGWSDSLDIWKVDLVLLPVRTPLATELAWRGWSVWRCDQTAVLLQRHGTGGDRETLANCVQTALSPAP
jgi:hypothetical protein